MHHNEMEDLTIEQLHELYNNTPFNVSLHNKAVKVWERVKSIEKENIFEELVRERGKKRS